MIRLHSILIVEPNDDLRQDLVILLQRNHVVYSCRDGLECLSILEKYHMDAMIINLFLPGIDGIGLLETAAESRPEVILTLSYVYPAYVLHRLTLLGVGSLLLLPCPVRVISARITDMLQTGRTPGMSACDITAKHLNILNAPRWDGYEMLRVGVPLFAQDPSQSITKELYPAIAQLFENRTANAVEASIRRLLAEMWRSRDPVIWKQYFPNTKSRISNKAFIARLAELLNT